MSNVSGIAKFVEVQKGVQKNGKPWTLTKFKVDDDKFNFPFNQGRAISDGDYVTFSYTVDPKKNKVVDVDSFKVTAPPVVKAGGGTTSLDDKDLQFLVRDIKARIGYSRSAAIDLVEVGIAKDIIAFPKSAKQGDKLDLLLEMVDKVTMHFYNMTEMQTNGIVNGDIPDDVPFDIDDVDAPDFAAGDLDD